MKVVLDKVIEVEPLMSLFYHMERFPVPHKLRMSPHFEPITEQQVIMTFGENNRTFVLEFLRWLGPGAELLEPQIWREQMREELEQMLVSEIPIIRHFRRITSPVT